MPSRGVPRRRRRSDRAHSSTVARMAKAAKEPTGCMRTSGSKPFIGRLSAERLIKPSTKQFEHDDDGVTLPDLDGAARW